MMASLCSSDLGTSLSFLLIASLCDRQAPAGGRHPHVLAVLVRSAREPQPQIAEPHAIAPRQLLQLAKDVVCAPRRGHHSATVVGNESNSKVVTPTARLAAPSAQIALTSDFIACPRGGRAAPKMLR